MLSSARSPTRWCVPLLWESYRRAECQRLRFRRTVTSWTVSEVDQQLTRGNSPSAQAESCRFSWHFASHLAKGRTAWCMVVWRPAGRFGRDCALRRVALTDGGGPEAGVSASARFAYRRSPGPAPQRFANSRSSNRPRVRSTAAPAPGHAPHGQADPNRPVRRQPFRWTCHAATATRARCSARSLTESKTSRARRGAELARALPARQRHSFWREDSAPSLGAVKVLAIHETPRCQRSGGPLIHFETKSGARLGCKACQLAELGTPQFQRKIMLSDPA
jgi:hypothetical protein